MKKAGLFFLLLFHLSALFSQVGTLTGTGMGVCGLFSFSICPNQTITPLNYGNQNYSCTGVSMPDISFNIQGSSWRVAKHNWFFSATVSGQLKGYDNTGTLQTIPFVATNTIAPLSYSGTYVQFGVNGVSTGPLLSQANFSISIAPVVFGNNSYTFCSSTASNVAISPVVPAQGGPWTYSWQPGNLSGNPVNVSPATSTIYTVTAKTTAGCTSTAAITVSVNCPPTPVCSGNTGSPVFLEDFGSGTALYGPALPAGVTTYPYVTGPPTNGSYVRSGSTDPSGVTGFAGDYLVAVGDHTGNPNGYMMVINSDYAASEVYRKHVTGLCPNTTYVFSAYLANNDDPNVQGPVCGSGYIFANVKFKVEYPVGTVQGSASTGNLPLSPASNVINWVHSGFVFTTGPAQNSVDVVMENNAPGGCGNDFVVDDISLSTCGPGMSLSIVPNATVFCPGQSVTLQSGFTSGSYVNPQYQWQFSNDGGLTWSNIGGATASTYSINSVSTSQSGSYQLIVAESGNVNSPACSILAGPLTFTVSSGTLSVNSPTLCSVQTVTLTATGATSYTWSTGASTPSIVVAPATTTQYTVSAAGSSCAGQAVATVSVITAPVVSVSVNPATAICSGASATLTASGADSYSWTNAATLSSSTGSVVIASPSVTSTYSVTGSVASCTNITAATVTVNPSPAITSASVTNASCGGANGSATVIATPSGNNYTWSGGVSSTANTAGNLAAGNYTVTIINGACQTSTVLSISNSGTLSITSSTVTPSACNSNNGSIGVTDNLANSVYSWTPAVATSTNTISGLAPGSYSLGITNGACHTTTLFIVSLAGGPTSLAITETDAVCGKNNGGLVVTNVTGGLAPYQYDVNNAGYTSAAGQNSLSQGVYTVTVKDANGCTKSQTIAVHIMPAHFNVSVTTAPPECESTGGTFTIDSISGGTGPYTVNFDNSIYTSVMTVENIAPGSYALDVKDSNQCVASYPLTMPDTEDYTLYIPNTFTPNNDKVNDTWFVSGSCLGAYSCLIYNRWGEKVKELTDIKDGWDGTYKQQQVPEGIYIYLLDVQTKHGEVNKTGHITLFR